MESKVDTNSFMIRHLPDVVLGGMFVNGLLRLVYPINNDLGYKIFVWMGVVTPIPFFIYEIAMYLKSRRRTNKS